MINSKSYLFITHLTPLKKRSILRHKLFELMKDSLFNQTYENWRALWLGEEESDDGKIKMIDISKSGSLNKVYLRDDVLKLINEADFLIKLDDDDIILPKTLEKASALEFDCYCDKFHTFYDVVRGRLTQQKRSWIAATCIHKKDLAILENRNKNISENFINSLFYGEHGKDWINFYKNKNLLFTPKKQPLYVRILSPTSITSGFKLSSHFELSKEEILKYYKYLESFGSWNSYNINGWEFYDHSFEKIKNQFLDISNNYQLKPTLSLKIKERIKYSLHA